MKQNIVYREHQLDFAELMRQKETIEIYLNNLEAEKRSLETERASLETERASLETELKAQKEHLQIHTEAYKAQWKEMNPNGTQGQMFIYLNTVLGGKEALIAASKNDIASTERLIASKKIALGSITNLIAQKYEEKNILLKTGGKCLTLDQYLEQLPPIALYAERLPDPSSTNIPFTRDPQCQLWDSFKSEVERFILNEVAHPSELINFPDFLVQREALPIKCESNRLPDMCYCNLFHMVSMHMNCQTKGTYNGQNELVEANPDGYVTRNGKLILVFGIKGKWNLDPKYFNEGCRIDNLRGKNTHIQSAIQQLYYYMIANHLTYGVLTSYDDTFFCKRVKNGHDEHLCISTAISLHSKSPTILQSMAYILSIANDDKFPSPPATPRMKTRSVSRQNSPRVSYTESNQSFQLLHELDQDEIDKDNISDDEMLFDLDYFEFKTCLGVSRATVFHDAKHDLAVKTICLFNQNHLLPELKNEVAIYKALEMYQGKRIPRLVSYGYRDGGSYCNCLSLCGKTPEKLSKEQKLFLLKSLDAIHDKGILHGDIKRKNIIVDEAGTPYLIDFAFSVMNAFIEDMEKERKVMIDMLKHEF